MSGSQTLVAGANVNASNNALTGESEMQVAINPANPLQIVDFTHNVNNLNQMSVYHSSDGGLTWSRTIISNTNDGLGMGTRFDPTLKFDANGHLFIAYGLDNGNNTTLVTARSDDGGSTFFQFRFPDSNGDNHNVPGVDKWFLTTGLDPTTGGQAVYIAYTHNANEVLGLDQQITVVGSNDGGNTYTAPQNIDDDSNSLFGLGRDSSLFACPAVGPNGELYVVWNDTDDGQLKLDRDLDGLWGNNSHFGNDMVVKNLRADFLSKITPASPRRGFSNGPSIDVSCVNPFQGRIYVAFTDTFSGNDTDVYLVSSDDNGSTWTSVGSVGNVEGSTGTDFMASVAVDQTSGTVNVGYYTTDGDQSGADGIANDDVNYRLASSIDGGVTWSHVNLSSATSRASAMGNGNEFGDYVGLAAYGGTVRGFWTDNRGQTADSEAFTATASFSSATGGNTLMVFGTNAADTIEVMSSSANPAYVEVFVDGQNQFTGLWSSINHIVVSGLGGDDAIFIDDGASGVPISVFGNDGNDTIHIAFPSGNLGHVVGPVSVDGGTGSDTVTLWNDLTSAGCTYTVTSSTVSVAGSAFGGLNYTAIEGLTINAGSGNDTVNVNSTAATTPLTVNAGGGNDVVNIGTGDLDSVQGAVTVNGQDGTDAVNLMDQTAPFNDTYNITNTTVSRMFATGGQTPFGGLTYGSIEALTLNAETGDNIINVISSASATPLTVNAGAGNDVVNIGTGDLDSVQGAVTVNGQAGTDVVNLMDQTAPFNDTYNITNSSVSRMFAGGGQTQFGGLTYGTIEGLTLNAETGNNVINVWSTAFGTPVTLNAGAGNDVINIQPSTPSGSSSLDTLMGAVTVNGQDGNDAVNINDQADAFNGDVYTITRSTVQRNAMALVTYGSVENLVVNGAGNAAITYNVTSTLSTTPVTINGGSRNDTFNVTMSAPDPATGIVVPCLSGALTVNGGAGTDTMTLNDQTDPWAFTWTITSSTVAQSGDALITYGTLEGLTINGGTWGVPYTVQSTAASTPVTIYGGSGSDTLIGPNLINTWNVTGTNQGAVGNVTFTSMDSLTGGSSNDVFVFGSGASRITGVVNGGGGVNTLSYPGYPSGVSVHLANSPTVGTATATGGVLNIQNVAGTMFNDTLIGNDQDNVFTTYGGRDTILCNGGNDTVRIVGLQDPASTMDGGSGSNLLWANDGTNTWTLSGVGSGSLVASVSTNPSVAMPFTNFQQVLGGLGSDTFRILPGASFTYLNGNRGVNWLDYSAYPSAVTVNLATFNATGVVGANCVFIQNVIGSRTASNTLTGNADPLGNILVGGNAADTITAGSARSILIGGMGADVLTGGTSDDIVIGGFTDYDQNQAALNAIISEWRSTTDSYLTRISKIRAGIVSGASTYSLIWGSGAGTTVHDDNAVDTLRGDPAGATTRGMDWFFANQATGTLDQILDLQTGEKVDNQP
jgi:Ca2+-binding RTX toxin-like protein